MEELKMKELDWDYTPAIPTTPPLQLDWNQTLHTKINQIWANNRLCYGYPKTVEQMPLYAGRKILMEIPLKFKSLIESLEFYRLFDQKYVVKFIDEDRDYINIGGCKLTIKNYK